jgi:hypothetical protein
VNAPAKKKRSWIAGCFILLMVALGLLASCVWMIAEPGRRAQSIHAAIHTGMSFTEVEQLLTGRRYCIYMVERPPGSGGWMNVSREEFAKLVAGPDPMNFRLSLTFMGMSPGRVSFSVDLDRAGRVQKLSEPHNWD